MRTLASTGLKVNLDSGSFLGVWAMAVSGVGGIVISCNDKRRIKKKKTKKIICKLTFRRCRVRRNSAAGCAWGSPACLRADDRARCEERNCANNVCNKVDDLWPRCCMRARDKKNDGKNLEAASEFEICFARPSTFHREFLHDSCALTTTTPARNVTNDLLTGEFFVSRLNNGFELQQWIVD